MIRLMIHALRFTSQYLQLELPALTVHLLLLLRGTTRFVRSARHGLGHGSRHRAGAGPGAPYRAVLAVDCAEHGNYLTLPKYTLL
jgi:hypothetical protein